MAVGSATIDSDGEEDDNTPQFPDLPKKNSSISPDKNGVVVQDKQRLLAKIKEAKYLKHQAAIQLFGALFSFMFIISIDLDKTLESVNAISKQDFQQDSEYYHWFWFISLFEYGAEQRLLHHQEQLNEPEIKASTDKQYVFYALLFVLPILYIATQKNQNASAVISNMTVGLEKQAMIGSLFLSCIHTFSLTHLSSLTFHLVSTAYPVLGLLAAFADTMRYLFDTAYRKTNTLAFHPTHFRNELADRTCFSLIKTGLAVGVMFSIHTLGLSAIIAFALYAIYKYRNYHKRKTALSSSIRDAKDKGFVLDNQSSDLHFKAADTATKAQTPPCPAERTAATSPATSSSSSNSGSSSPRSLSCK